MSLKPGPKPLKEDGTHDQRRRDRKGNGHDVPQIKPAVPKKKR